MGLIEVIRDDFVSGTILNQFPGNGSLVFPGAVAQLVCPNSQNCNWDHDHGPYAPVLWSGFDSRSKRGMPNRIETKMNSFVRTTNLCLAGIVVFPLIKLPQSMYYMTYYANESKIIVNRQYGTGATRLYSSGAVPDPATTPHLYRVYSNKSEYGLYIPEMDTTLATGKIGFAYSTDGGSTWTMAHTRTVDVEYYRAGVFAKKWATGVGDNCTAEFEYFVSEQYSEEDLAKDPPIGNVTFEEQIVFPTTQGGVPRGPLALDHGAVERASGTTFLDENVFPPAGGFSSPGPVGSETGKVIGAGSQVKFGEEISLELFEGPDYMQDKDDADGTEFLQGLNMRTLKAVDLTLDLWNTHGAGFYGTAKDGKNYYNGEECSPTGPDGTSFGTVALGPNRRCWSMWPGAPPMDSYKPSSIAVTIPTDHTLRLVGTALASEGSSVYSLWYLDGDFDVQIDWSGQSDSGGTNGGFALKVWADPDNLCQVRRRSSAGVAENGRHDGSVRINGSYGSTYAFADAAGAASGKYRIVRVGSVVSRWYWGGSSWVQIGSDVDMGRADPMFVGTELYGEGSLNYGVDATSFTIASGTVISTVGWSREVAGDHRGLGDECPTKHIWVATDDSLNVIDTENDRMWMRFTEGSGQILNPDWGGTDKWVHQVVLSQGVALIAWHGALVRLDFNMSDVRIGRLLTDTSRGARKKTTHGNLYGGWRCAASVLNSHIVTRNLNTGFGTPSLNAWQIDARDVNSVDLWHTAGYEYRAIATAGGMRMQKWRRWYMQGSTYEGIETPDWSYWTTATATLWCFLDKATGELFWHDGTNMYSVPKTNGGSTGWEDRMDESPFPDEISKALPGTREWRSQNFAVRYGAYLFLVADEGIYRVNWPSGSWELFYGNAVSAATHKVLPNYSFPTAIDLAKDGSEDLLVVGMIDGVVVVKLSDNTEYARTPVEGGQFTLAVSA